MRPTSRAASINGCLVVSRQAVVCPKTATDGPFRRRMAMCLCSSTGSQPHRQTDDDRAAIVTPIGAYNAPILSDSVHFRVRSTALSLILGQVIGQEFQFNPSRRSSSCPCRIGQRTRRATNRCCLRSPGSGCAPAEVSPARCVVVAERNAKRHDRPTCAPS